MTVWFTSDPHIGHRLVAGLRYQALNDVVLNDTNVIWDTVTEWHDQYLADNWDSVVGKDDQVWVLGDISAGGKQAQFAALDWLQDRPGVKHLISGNHDGVHPMHGDAHKLHGRYQEAFVTVSSAGTRKIALPDGSHQRVLLSHFPYEGDHTEGDRFDQWRFRNMSLALLHGHVHSAEKVTYASVGRPNRENDPWEIAKQIHVGLDAWALAPVGLEQIGELL